MELRARIRFGCCSPRKVKCLGIYAVFTELRLSIKSEYNLDCQKNEHN